MSTVKPGEKHGTGKEESSKAVSAVGQPTAGYAQKLVSMLTIA